VEVLMEHHRVAATHSGVQIFPIAEESFQPEQSDNFLLDVAAERS